MSTTPNSTTTEEGVIRTTAYFLWEQAGCPDGRSEEFWFEAELSHLEPKAATTVEPAKPAEPTANAKKAA